MGRALARLWLGSAAALVLALWNPLSAQPGKTKSPSAKGPAAPQTVSVEGLWKTSDGLTVRLHQAGTMVQSSFGNSSCQCDTGSPRTFYIKGELSWRQSEEFVSNKWRPIVEQIVISSATIQVCTDAGLWKDCHGKGLNPDTDVWETAVAEATCSAANNHSKIVECTSIEGMFLGQYYQKKVDDKGKVVNCTRTDDPRRHFSLTRTTERLPKREPTPPGGNRGLDPKIPVGKAPPGGLTGFLQNQLDDAIGAVHDATKTGEDAANKVTDPIKNDKGYKRLFGPENHNQ
jgi:hypothetical protein